MMNKERLTIEEQLEEIKDCGRRFNESQYYCLYKYDIERIIPYIEDLQQRIDKIMEIIELNQYSYGYQIKDEILGGKE